MYKEEKKICFGLLFVFLLYIITPLSFSKYTSSTSDTINLTVTKATYTVHFNANGGSGTMADMVIEYGERKNLNPNSFTRSEYNFMSWNTKQDGSGTTYTDEQQIYNEQFIENHEITLYAQWVQGVAEVNGTIYESLQDAVNAVPNNTQTTVILLTNTSEQINVSENKNIIFDLRNNTITNVEPNKSIIENSGTIRISNGTLRSSGEPAAINNNNGGTLIMTGGTIEASSSNKGQAIYNNGGTVEISGTAYLSSSSTNRATVHNLSTGLVKITGGTIISNNYSAVYNASGSNPIELGEKDGTVSTTTPILQGAIYAFDKTGGGKGLKFYDGIIKGKTNTVSNENTMIIDKETGYEVAHKDEVIDGQTYKTSYLAITSTVTFNPTGGTVSEPTRKVEINNQVGTLPTPGRPGYQFDGWFTLESGGEEVLPSRIITSDITFFAHWTKIDVAEIDGVCYGTLQEAINAVPNNTLTTITLTNDTSENVTVDSNKNIIFDFANYTASNLGNKPVISNDGTIRIIGGTIRQTMGYAAIDNNNNGTLIITGGSVYSTGGKGAIYNTDNGTVEISGDAYLSSNAAGAVNEGFNRATVMNVSPTGHMTITGGTIISTNSIGVFDNGTLTIGIKSDGNISNSSPSITGNSYGVETHGTFNYYDGIIKGVTGTINGTITEQEPNTNLVNGTETIDDKTYNTVHLEAQN